MNSDSKSYELANCLLVVLWINDLPFNSIQKFLHLQIFPIYFDAKKVMFTDFSVVVLPLVQ